MNDCITLQLSVLVFPSVPDLNAFNIILHPLPLPLPLQPLLGCSGTVLTKCLVS